MFAVAPIRLMDLARELNHASRAVGSDLRQRVRPVLDRASARLSIDSALLEAALAAIEPTLSLRVVRARVMAITDETADTKTFWLRPNARFGSFRPGSYVTLQLRIDGQPIARSYSLSAAPRPDGLIAITVKRVAGGKVSNWLADTLRPGHVVELSEPRGQFVLPAQLPGKLLLLSAGSGITPVMSMLRQLVSLEARPEIVFCHFARTPRDIIFREELERMACIDNVRLELCVESSARIAHEPAWTGALGRVSEALLLQMAPDFRSLDTFLCGPGAFMQSVLQIFERAGADLSKLRYERFNTEFDASQFLEHTQLVRFRRSGTESLSNRPRTILEAAEGAGLSVPFGCRAGNCGSCRCRKTAGVVVDITSGRASGAGEEFIFPCVSVARGTVEVDL
ncbi:MAG TPA: hybrid-cluster NAD(P)-dependent oxidoreductase [Polyangiales bacterium]|nr:hybrid-cluster NAD(P)-dependent oxidoreductase [Polyangiales bacterium]